MPEPSIIACGLPSSGKTTFLAAFWHLVTAQECETVLSLRTLKDGDATYLNEIAARWRDARVQERTKVGHHKIVTMQLATANGDPFSLTFPDLSGETFRRMWEDRECDAEIAELLKKSGDGVALFVHADTIQAPLWITDVQPVSSALQLLGASPPAAPVPWEPKFAPTQVQIVALLQFLESPPLEIRSRRITIVLSAWDKAEPEQRTPAQFLAERLPLLDQYLTARREAVDVRIVGVSAQGGDYEPDAEMKMQWSREQVEALRMLDMPSERIRVVDDNGTTKDLTEMIAWLAE